MAQLSWSYQDEHVIVLLCLIGAGLMLPIAARPRDRTAPLMMFGSILLIAGPVALYLVPQAIHPDEYAPLFNAQESMLQPCTMWEGGWFALIFILPVLLLALLIANRGAGSDTETDPGVGSGPGVGVGAGSGIGAGPAVGSDTDASSAAALPTVVPEV